MNLFISHSWTYFRDYDRLKSLLENRGYFNFRNYSVENDDPKNNWAEIENNIKWSILSLQVCMPVIVRQ